MSTVTDPVDKYRHGVLLGNYVQDKFGADLLAQQRHQDPKKVPATKEYHDPAHSLYRPHPVISQSEAATSNFYETSRNYQQGQYRKPEDETSYNIFHRQELIPQVPLVRNDPKKEHIMAKDGKLYEHTRYYLANKFAGSLDASEVKPASLSKPDRELLRETGNIGSIRDQEIPDILTGEIWKPAIKKPDADTKVHAKNYDQPIIKVGTAANIKTANPFGATSLVKPEVTKFDNEVYKRYVLPNDKGEQRDTLFGHGLELEEFQRRQLATAYDLSYNQQVPPQTQVNSFFNPDAEKSAKKFHRETVHEKNHQGAIPEYGTKALLGQEKVGRPYAPYTKTYDLNHLKNEYLRK